MFCYCIVLLLHTAYSFKNDYKLFQKVNLQ